MSIPDSPEHRYLRADRGEIPGAHAALGHAAGDLWAATPPAIRLRRLPFQYPRSKDWAVLG
jgi:hypothetical protein